MTSVKSRRYLRVISSLTCEEKGTREGSLRRGLPANSSPVVVGGFVKKRPEIVKKRSTDENGSQKCGGEGGTGVWWGRGAKSREVCNFGGWVIIFDLSTFKRPKRKDFYAVAVGPKKPVFSGGVLGKNSKQLRFSARL